MNSSSSSNSDFNTRCLRAACRLMALMSRLFSLLTLMAVLCDMLFVFLSIDPILFLGPSLSLKGDWYGFTFSYFVTGTTNGKPITTWAQFHPDFTQLLWLIVTIPYLMLFWALHHATSFFKMISKGDLFQTGNSKNLRNLAVGGLIFCATAPFMYSEISAITKLFYPGTTYSGTPLTMHFSLAGLGTVSVSWIGILIIVFIGVIAITANVMRRAAELADEHAQIV